MPRVQGFAPPGRFWSVRMQVEDGVTEEAEFDQPVRDVAPARLEEPESFSAGIFRELRKSPFFRPKLKKDGTISDRDMGTATQVALAAADQRIWQHEQTIERLAKRAAFWNQPMFQPALPAAAADAARSGKPEGEGKDDAATKAENDWFARHLTLRNVLSVFVLLGGAVWTFFAWYTSDKNVEIEHQKSAVAAAVARADSAEKSKDQIEKDARFYKEANKDLQGERDAAKAEAAAEKTKTATEQTKSAQLQKALDAARVENKQLIDALKAKAAAPAAAPAVAASGAK
jgi:hypothetical protein